MLIPYSTDAPIYHYPIATVTLIVINVIVFFGVSVGVSEVSPQVAFELEPAPDWREELLLQYGQGLRPWQWITNMFMHANIVHLVGNMIFLWSFGLVLEGKMGWLLFLTVYVGMGCFQSFLLQTSLFFLDGASLGASGAIFSLMALVVIFAPLNCYETVLWIMIRPLFFETPILVFCGFYLAMNLFFFALSGASFGTEALHLVGFFVGIPMGLVLLFRGCVDCEGFDIVSHYTDKKGTESIIGVRQRKVREAKRDSREFASLPKIDQAQLRVNLSGQIDQAIQEGNVDLAVALQSKIASNNLGATWKEPQLMSVIQHYMKTKEYAKAERFLERHIELFDDHRFPLQMRLIKIWLHAERPRHALTYMRGLNLAFLSDPEKRDLRKLAEYAQSQIQSGVLEAQ